MTCLSCAAEELLVAQATCTPAVLTSQNSNNYLKQYTRSKQTSNDATAMAESLHVKPELPDHAMGFSMADPPPFLMFPGSAPSALAAFASPLLPGQPMQASSLDSKPAALLLAQRQRAAAAMALALVARQRQAAATPDHTAQVAKSAQAAHQAARQSSIDGAASARGMQAQAAAGVQLQGRTPLAPMPSLQGQIAAGPIAAAAAAAAAASSAAAAAKPLLGTVTTLLGVSPAAEQPIAQAASGHRKAAAKPASSSPPLTGSPATGLTDNASSHPGQPQQEGSSGGAMSGPSDQSDANGNTLRQASSPGNYGSHTQQQLQDDSSGSEDSSREGPNKTKAGQVRDDSRLSGWVCCRSSCAQFSITAGMTTNRSC